MYIYKKKRKSRISYPYVGHFWPEANYCGWYRSTFSAKYEGFYCLKFFEYRADVPNLSKLPGSTADFRARPPAHRGSEYRLTTSPTLVKTCPLFFNAHVRKYAINTPFWCHSGKFPRRHLTVTKADVLYLYTKKPAVKTAGGNLPGWRIEGDDEMREATCARTSTSMVPTESWTSG